MVTELMVTEPTITGSEAAGSVVTEPVTVSCDLLAAVAPWTCRESTEGRCDWYHGSWQYLRLLGLVSNPGFHTEYLQRTLRARFAGHTRVSALVSGCADYSTFAHVTAALGDRTTVTALDWCPTPLIATEWFARHNGLPAPRSVVADAAGFVEPAAHDLIISDSFLPRFGDAELRRLLRSWRASLRSGGFVVTTVRVHERPGAAGARPQAASWREIAESHRHWWPTVSTIPPAEMVERVVRFAERQERNAVHDVATLRGLFADAGFERVEVDVAETDGKSFARVAAG